MDTYTIRKAYHWTTDLDIEIDSENIRYSELNKTHSGCQCRNLSNQEAIHKKCTQIAQLIREIEILNQKS